MNTHRSPRAFALISAALIAAGATAGCTRKFVESTAQSPPALLASQNTGGGSPATGDDIRALTQKVDWSSVNGALAIEGY